MRRSRNAAGVWPRLWLRVCCACDARVLYVMRMLRMLRVRCADCVCGVQSENRKTRERR